MNVTGDIHHISGNSGAGGHLACAQPVKKNIANHVTGEMNGIKGAVDLGQQMALRHHGRMHPGLHMLAMIAAYGQQLDPAAELAGKLDIHRLDPGNPLGSDIVMGDIHAVGHGHENGQLVGGINSLDIIGGVGLGKSLLLRIPEHHIKGSALIGHAGEDIVGRSIHDPHDRKDFIGHQSLFQGLDHRDTAADTGLETDLDPFCRRSGKDILPLLGKQGLVCRHHMLAGGNGIHDKGLGRLDTADQLDDDIYFRIIDQLGRVPV